MSNHLPECLLPDFDKGTWVCICAQLRACEQRVLTDTALLNEIRNEQFAKGVQACRDAVAALPFVSHPFAECGDVECCGVHRNTVGYAAGLAAAHDAVAALKGDWVFGPRIYKHEALHVIKSLKEKP